MPQAAHGRVMPKGVDAPRRSQGAAICSSRCRSHGVSGKRNAVSPTDRRPVPRAVAENRDGILDRGTAHDPGTSGIAAEIGWNPAFP